MNAPPALGQGAFFGARDASMPAQGGGGAAQGSFSSDIITGDADRGFDQASLGTLCAPHDL